MPAANSVAAVAPPKVPSTGASGRLAPAPVELPDMSIPGISGDMAGALVAGELPPDMSIPGISAGMLAEGAGVGVLPDMSIPGMSAGMLAVGVGVLPDMSIPGISAGMPAVLAGVGELPDLTANGTAAALVGVAADDSWCEVSVNDPRTAIAAAAVPTETTRIRRRHPGASDVRPRWLVSVLRSRVLLI
jgi:hypothetical protein